MKFISVAALAVAAYVSVVLASPLPLEERATCPALVTTFDDSDQTVISYSGTWTHLNNQGSIVHNGTQSFSHDSYASYGFSAGYGSTGQTNLHIKIHASKKNDRGYFAVTAGGNAVGFGDAHTNQATETETTVVFTGYVPNAYPGSYIYVQNYAYDSRINAVPYLDVDFVETYWTS